MVILHETSPHGILLIINILYTFPSSKFPPNINDAKIFIANKFVGMHNRDMNGPALKRATGNWVVGDQFWDREIELSLFMERLSEGAHLLVTAPRRIGKTSLLKEAARRLGERFLCLCVDLEKAESPADAVVELSLAAREYRPAWDRVLSDFQHALTQTVEAVKIKDLSVVLRSGLTADNWRSKGTAFVIRTESAWSSPARSGSSHWCARLGSAPRSTRSRPSILNLGPVRSPAAASKRCPTATDSSCTRQQSKRC